MSLEHEVMQALSPEMNQACLFVSRLGEKVHEMCMVAYDFKKMKDSETLMYHDLDNMRIIYEKSGKDSYRYYGMHRI